MYENTLHLTTFHAVQHSCKTIYTSLTFKYFLTLKSANLNVFWGLFALRQLKAKRYFEMGGKCYMVFNIFANKK